MSDTHPYEVKNLDEEFIFEEFMNCVVEIQVHNRIKPVRGKLIKCTPQYITLERRSGSPTTIKRCAVELIQTISDNFKAVV